MLLETIAPCSGLESDPVTLPLHREGFGSGRIANPVSVLEQLVTELERGAAALAAATGQAALHCAFSNIADGGGNIVATPLLCGATYELLTDILPQAGITGRFAADHSAGAMAAQIDGGTRGLFCESARNSEAIEAFARVADAHGIPLIVDNSLMSPAVMRPLELGADIVVRSLTEFGGRRGSAFAGTIVESGCFDWMGHAARFPQFAAQDSDGLVYAEAFPEGPFTARARKLLAAGAVLPPMRATQLLPGIEALVRHI